ncbi:MAG: hypothetical protein ACFB15_31285 [Cyclobacteriaceae bacterium]
MKISEELILRYYSGECSEEERQFVEKWLESSEDEPSKYSDEFISQIKEETWDKILSEKINREQIRSEVSQELPTVKGQKLTTKKDEKVVPMYKRIIRYAAVACLFIGTFFLGYIASPNAQADTIETSQQLTDVLHVYGGNDTYAKMDAARYRIKFEGTLSLYNGSQTPQQIVCGEQEFTLEPHRAYRLRGSDRKAYLAYESSDVYDDHITLSGGFSILKLND